MSNITAMGHVNNALVWIDQICDYLPIVSTVTNLVDIFEKCAFSGFCSSESIKSNHYFSYINEKSLLRCVTLLVPVLGNILVGINDPVQNHPTEDSERLASIKAAFLTKSNSIRESFHAFIEELETEIFRFYELHETAFDNLRIHSRMHIARAIIFAEVMARYYANKGILVNFNYVRRTVGLHDAGRKANGPDNWEQDSSDLLCKHLISKNIPEKDAQGMSTIIVKDKADKNSIEFKIFQSADCLDIMRPCTGNGGRKGFKPEYLTFLANPEPDEAQFREKLIEEAWFFIQLTEDQKETNFNDSKGFMGKLFEIIRQHEDELPILSSILEDKQS